MISSLSHDNSDMERHNQQAKHSLFDHAGEEGAEAMTEPLAQEVRNYHSRFDPGCSYTILSKDLKI